MLLGKIIKSISHTDYICQVFGPSEAETSLFPVDYAFGTFVRIPLEGTAA
jgi:hypothetical protein